MYTSCSRFCKLSSTGSINFPTGTEPGYESVISVGIMEQQFLLHTFDMMESITAQLKIGITSEETHDS